MNGLGTLLRALGGARHSTGPTGDEARLVALETHATALYDHGTQLRQELRELTRELQQLRQDEARRAAEHAAMVDQLNRLYRRMAARIAREAEHPLTGGSDSPHNGESTMELRRRLGR